MNKNKFSKASSNKLEIEKLVFECVKIIIYPKKIDLKK